MKTYVVSELTLLPLLLEAGRGRKIRILAVDPYLPPLAGMLGKIVDRMIAAGRATWVVQDFPELADVVAAPTNVMLRDVFAKIEDWQNRRCRFTESEADARYGMAYRQVSAKVIESKYIQALFLEKIEETETGLQNIRGMHADTRGLYAAWRGQQGGTWDRPRRWNVGSLLVNPLLLGASTLFSWAWILRRLRGRIVAGSYFLAADYLRDPRDNRLYRCAAEGGPLLLVKRTQALAVDTLPDDLSATVAEADAGGFTLLGALIALGLVLGDGLRLLGTYGRMSPTHFYAVSTLPHKRIVFRAFFNRYRPAFYWGRDEYNVEHILRRQELHRIGGRSLGLMHGVQALGDLNPRRRYIDFDVFYIFGPHLYEKHYKKTWAKDMAVRPIGSFGFSREQFDAPFPKDATDIAIFVALGMKEPEIARTIREICLAFPERRVLVKPKYLDRSHTIDDLLDAIGRDVTNMEMTRRAAHDLMAGAAVVLSDASTVVTEALHLGRPTLMLDMLTDHRQCLYRDFPGLCVRTAEGAVTQITKWFKGSETFDRNHYNDLIDVSGRWFIDIIREDLGLTRTTDGKGKQ
ncbi:hypothetical protein JCM17960_13960 [Magnetospira thiophila]